jgi:hypothetical protein
MRIMRLLFTMLIAWISLFKVQGQSLSQEDFNDPPIRFWPRPLWFWNNAAVDEQGVTRQMQEFRDQCGYGGFSILPFGLKFKPEYLSEDYFRVYGKALEKARELGMTMCMYDEFGFPSGGAGAVNGDDIPRFQLRFPQQTILRLDKLEKEVSGPAVFEEEIPKGKLMSVVAMESVSLKRVDLAPFMESGILKWNVPQGKWKIMFFTCVNAGEPIADYLDPEAVRNFIGMTHDAYYSHFRDYFGPVIFGSFFDEPTMFHAQNRMWTGLFNEKFIRKYGRSPVLLYPALWYDIGSETQSARNALLGFRAELFAEGFIKQVNDWSVAHGIMATGHIAPEEVLNPVNSCGDLMKSFKYLQIPGIDKIGGDRPAERFYKLISSSAYNWDKSLVMSETYGAMPNFDEPGDLTWNQIFSIAMDQYTKGINMLIPHAVWYDNQNVTYKPELSDRNLLYADSLKSFTRFLARLNAMLQNGGRHVADIGILYPIYSLQGEHVFDGPNGPADEFYKGDMAVTKIDYVETANWLTNIPGLDYTFLHPEILDEKCTGSNGKLHLQNDRNWEDFQVLIVPACKTISYSNLVKIAGYYNQGGLVIFTTLLPYKSYESGMDQKVTDLVRSIFPDLEKSDGIWQKSVGGGKAIFIRQPDERMLRKAIFDSGLRFDIQYKTEVNVQHIHKVTGKQEIYYFANMGDTPVNTQVTLRGKLKLESYDPHSGKVEPLITHFAKDKSSSAIITDGQLTLKPFHSCFWVGERTESE